MRQIKFSHTDYQKFRYLGIEPPFRATLLQVFTLDSTEISGIFQKYDTRYFEKQQEKHYPLNPQVRAWIVLLLQESTTGNLFTTMRSHNPEKFQYYKDCQGQTFEIISTDQSHIIHKTESEQQKAGELCV